jgi:hypothetical protein
MSRVVADQIQAIVAWPRECCRPADSRRYGRKLLDAHARDRAMGRFASLTSLSADPSRTRRGRPSHGSWPARFNPRERVGCEA